MLSGVGDMLALPGTTAKLRGSLRATLAPGPAAERGERALACARELLAAPVQDRPNWTLARLRAEIEARTGVRVSQGPLSVLLREKGGSAGAGPATA